LKIFLVLDFVLENLQHKVVDDGIVPLQIFCSFIGVQTFSETHDIVHLETDSLVELDDLP
jgi:hypothetical protein